MDQAQSNPDVDRFLDDFFGDAYQDLIEIARGRDATAPARVERRRSDFEEKSPGVIQRICALQEDLFRKHFPCKNSSGGVGDIDVHALCGCILRFAQGQIPGKDPGGAPRRMDHPMYGWMAWRWIAERCAASGTRSGEWHPIVRTLLVAQLLDMKRNVPSLNDPKLTSESLEKLTDAELKKKLEEVTEGVEGVLY